MSMSAVSNNMSNEQLATVQGHAQMAVIKKAAEMQGQQVLQLVAALPQPAPVQPGQPGAIVNTFA